MLVATIILLLFFWGLFSGSSSLTASLYVDTVTAVLAGVSLAVSFLLYLWAPYKYVLQAAIVVYVLLVASTGALIVQSDGAGSPFIALWLIVGVFSGIFGWWGIGALLTIANIYIIYHFLQGNTSTMDIILNVLAAEMPILASYLLWNDRETPDPVRDHDVTSLNKSLEQESTKSDAIIQSIGDGVMMVGPTGEVLLINPAAQKITGWSQKDATHIHYSAIIKLEDSKGTALEGEQDPILQVLNTAQLMRTTNATLITKSGKRLAADFVVSPIGSAAEGAIAVFRDVTKERAEEREQAEFISTASHEMRTPVASIEGYLGLALNPNTATIDEKARDYINKAHESAQHLGRLFQDLLDVSKADDGRLRNEPTAIDAVSFTRDVVESLLPTAQQKDLSILFKPDGSKATVGSTVIAPMLYTRADKDHLREVLNNLVENAIKYTLKGHIEVDVVATDTYVRISVTDSGVGIPAEDISHLFQKFYRVDNSETREIGGTGLGLYLSRRLVETMEGRLWVESEYKKGSTFFVELPRLDHAKATMLIEQENQKREKTKEEATDASPKPISTPEPQTPEPAAAPTPIPTLTPPPAQTPATAPPEPIPDTPEPSPPTLPPELAVPAQPIPVTPATAAPTPSPAPTLPPNPFGAIPYGDEPQAPQTTPSTPQTPPTAAPITQSVTPQSSPSQPQRHNTPLSDLEANPERYTATRSANRRSSQNQS